MNQDPPLSVHSNVTWSRKGEEEKRQCISCFNFSWNSKTRGERKEGGESLGLPPLLLPVHSLTRNFTLFHIPSFGVSIVSFCVVQFKCMDCSSVILPIPIFPVDPNCGKERFSTSLLFVCRFLSPFFAQLSVSLNSFPFILARTFLFILLRYPIFPSDVHWHNILSSTDFTKTWTAHRSGSSDIFHLPTIQMPPHTANSGCPHESL